MIEFLKNVYSLEEIKSLFAKMESTTVDGNMDAIFDDFLEMYNNSVTEWKDSLGGIQQSLQDKPDDSKKFYLLLMLMAHSAATKEIVQMLMKENE